MDQVVATFALGSGVQKCILVYTVSVEGVQIEGYAGENVVYFCTTFFCPHLGIGPKRAIIYGLFLGLRV